MSHKDAVIEHLVWSYKEGDTEGTAERDSDEQKMYFLIWDMHSLVWPDLKPREWALDSDQPTVERDPADISRRIDTRGRLITSFVWGYLGPIARLLDSRSPQPPDRNRGTIAANPDDLIRGPNPQRFASPVDASQDLLAIFPIGQTQSTATYPAVRTRGFAPRKGIAFWIAPIAQATRTGNRAAPSLRRNAASGAATAKPFRQLDQNVLYTFAAQRTNRPPIRQVKSPVPVDWKAPRLTVFRTHSQDVEHRFRSDIARERFGDK